MEHTMKVIARIHSDFPEKFGIPRQSGLVPALRAKIVFEPEYRNPDALRGIEGFSHLWLIWQFSAAVRDTWSPTVRPPHPEALGGFAPSSKETIEVKSPPELLQKLPEGQREALLGVLAQDPRPQYQNDPERVYGMSFGGWDVKFRVKDGVLTVLSLAETEHQ